MVYGIDAEVIPRLEAGRIGFVRDDAERARLRACTVQRALGTCERFDTRHVIDVHIERALNRGDGLLVEVDGHARLGTRVVRVLAARDAAHVHRSGAWAEGLIGHARQELGVVVEIGNAQLFELRSAEGGDAEGHRLQALIALLRGHHNFFELAVRRRVLREGGGHGGQKGRSEGGAFQQRPGSALRVDSFALHSLEFAASAACHRRDPPRSC